MKDFAAIDFETANNERSSVCCVGVVIVRDGDLLPLSDDWRSFTLGYSQGGSKVVGRHLHYFRPR